MKIIICIVSLLTIITCQVKKQALEERELPKVELKKDKKQIQDTTFLGKNRENKEISISREGFIEFKAYEKKYKNKWKTKPNVFPYSDLKKVKVFKLDCSGECEIAVFRERVSRGKEISKEGLIQLIDLLKNPNSYGNTRAMCYDPKFGLIIYDEQGVPMEFLDICLDCNDFNTHPFRMKPNYKNENLKGFSRRTRRELRKMFSKWGIDYYGFSEIWDNKKEYEKYLERKKKDSIILFY